MASNEVDVLIIGGGPTGLTLALELSLYKIPFRIIDKLLEPSDKSRALVIQSRSLELLNRHSGLATALTSQAVQATGARIYANKKPIADIDYADVAPEDTAFPDPIWLSQANTEGALVQALAAHGHAVERGLAADSDAIAQDDSGVTVALRRADGTTDAVRARYVVGCDGAHSAVRRAAGLTFDGAAYAEQFLLLDCAVAGDYELGRINFLLGRRMLMLLPFGEGRVRLVGIRTAADAGKPATVDEFRQLLAENAPPEWSIGETDWLASFRFHRRGVDAYRKGRLLVAGDAAHIHSPAGGQGMNTGIGDAVNLGWKLALVLRGERDESFLDSYNVERHRVGQHLLEGTDKFFSYIASASWYMRVMRTIFVPFILPLFSKLKCWRVRLIRFISELGIRYRQSPTVATAAGYQGLVKAGDRVPDAKVADAEGEESFLLSHLSAVDHTILLLSGLETGADLDVMEKSIVAKHPELRVLRVYGPGLSGPGLADVGGGIHKRYGLPKGGLLLVRPDLHVAFTGMLSSFDEMLLHTM